MPANAVVVWVYYPRYGGAWRWRDVATYGDETAAQAWLTAFLARVRTRPYRRGIDGVVLPAGVPPIGARAAR